MATRSTKIREPKVSRIARRSGVPDAQIANDQFVMHPVKNANDGDLRDMTRSKVTHTVRRKPKLEQLRGKVLDNRQIEVCEWYLGTHAMAFDTIGITANYGESNGGGNTSFTHLARYKEQGQARIEFAHARAGVDSILAPLLDRVVIYGRSIGRLNLSFRRAIDQLVDRVEGMGVL